jgi:acetyltransferase-like isoleucine patch superfamily enzyme
MAGNQDSMNRERMNENPKLSPRRIAGAFEQLRFLFCEMKRIVNKKYWRWITIWFGGCVRVNISYRFDRSLYLVFGRVYPVIRPVFFPAFFVCALLGGRHEIHYRARIGPGLKILHTSLGIVISGMTVAGEKLTLTGGNLIGGRKRLSERDILIGSRVYLGANSVILGPVEVGDDAKVGGRGGRGCGCASWSCCGRSSRQRTASQVRVNI